MAETLSSFPLARERRDERRRQNQRSADQISQAQVLYQDEVRRTQFDAIVADVIDDARIGADGEEHQERQERRLQRTVQDRHRCSEFKIRVPNLNRIRNRIIAAVDVRRRIVLLTPLTPNLHRG